MALSFANIGGAAGVGSFVLQVQAALQSTVTAVLGESNGTADYVVRRKFAQFCEKNLGAAAIGLAVAVATQIQAANPTKYADLSGITDGDVSTAISGIFTQVAYANVLPS